ncbi:hypothetical protein QTH90_00910 [Variovorax sp. J2P1-59]|uniref:hypothetical protein n=1 Tax=Variovorax flavidus TaxID=3053501 RepID=UPI00257518DD|nr:hypothetical protein [Variovorax sp. J2P1-59]MDM0072921.1 hypothetical protein [Variovorax sp. J2P1-59]
MVRRFLFATCLLGAFCAPGHAACDTGLAERMHAKLHPKRALDHERAVCEPWRGLPGRFIVVLPMPRPSSEPGATQFDLDVLVVQQADNGNTDRARIVSRLFEESALTEDAVRIGEIKIDTARYTLAADTRAFGVRILRQGSSRASPYSEETLTLYVPQGQKLAKVLDSLQMTLERGEWDTNCTGNFETVRGSLSVARGSTHSGYADLILREAQSKSRSALQGEECATHERAPTFKATVLRYDGAGYRASKAVASD